MDKVKPKKPRTPRKKKVVGWIQVTTVDEHKRPIFIRADKIISLLKVKEGTHIECESGKMHYCIEYIDDVKMMIDLTLGGE
jgi:hypothetical protein